MTTTIVSEKGQLTLPSAIRRKAHIHPGTRVEIEVREDEIILRPLKSLRELAGVFRYAAEGKTGTFEEIREQVMTDIAKEIVHEDRE